MYQKYLKEVSTRRLKLLLWRTENYLNHNIFKKVMGGQDISTIKEGLKNSFQNIKQDMDNLKLQSNQNNQQIAEIKELLTSLMQELHTLKKNNPDRLKQEMISKVKRNRRSIIKAKILELIETERYSIPEIKEVIVDHDKYCSKATFYRYISELKNSIEEIKIGSKTIIVPIKTDLR